MTSWYKQQLKDWVAELDVKAEKVLDIGGVQDKIKGRTKSWEVDEYLVSDLEVPHVGTDPDIIFDINYSLSPPNPVGNRYNHYFDLIFCLEVLDYVFDPVTAFRNISLLLKDGGIAWISCGLIYPRHNPIEEDTLRLTDYGIRRLAAAADLELKEVVIRRPKPGNTHLLEFYAEDGMRAARGLDHNITGWICKLQR